VRKIVLKNGGIHGFYNELLYGAGTGYGEGTIHAMEVLLENMKVTGSNHTALNYQDANLTDINGEYGNAYLAAEQYGCDSRFIGTVFRDAGGMNYSAANRGLVIIATEGYDYPAQDTVLRKTQLVGVTHRKVDTVYIGPYTYGSANAIDSQYNVRPLGFSCNLDLTHTIDQTNNVSALVIVGPGAVPAGNRVGMVPRDLNIRLSCKATLAAVAAGHNYGSVIQFEGYLDPDSCTITVDCSATTDKATDASGTQYAMPRIIWNSWVPFDATTQQVPGYSLGGVTATALDAARSGITAYPNGTAGGENMTFAALDSGGAYEGFAQGQEFYFCYGNSAGRFNFARDGAGMALTRDRSCFEVGDRIVFIYDKHLGKWVDNGGHTRDTLAGSATYNAPNIAAGGSTSTTVTVTGAAIGDFAAASLGINAAALVLTASVTAANTVTVVLANLTGAAVDLASATLSVIVTRR
jgi:hypothetical protein